MSLSGAGVRTHGQRMYLAAMAAPPKKPTGYIDEENPETESPEVKLSFFPIVASQTGEDTMVRPPCPSRTTVSMGRSMVSAIDKINGTGRALSARVSNANIRWRMAMNARITTSMPKNKTSKVKFNIP